MKLIKYKLLDILGDINQDINQDIKRNWNTEIRNNTCLFWNNIIWETIREEIRSDILDRKKFIKLLDNYREDECNKVYKNIIEKVNVYNKKMYNCRYIKSLKLKSFGVFLELIEDKDYINIIECITLDE